MIPQQENARFGPTDALWRLEPSIVLALIVFLFFLTGCGGSIPDDNDAAETDLNPPPIVDGTWYRPVTAVTWQWQLQGAVNTAYNVDLYDIDLFDSSEALIRQLQADGKKVICYFSAGSYEAWRPDAGQFEPESLGNPLDDWPGERWLDIRNENVRIVMKDRLDLAQQKGCDGVEPDNVDAYANDSGFDLTPDDQLVFNRFIANETHARGLAAGLKNDLDQINDLIAYYDFAVNEQCFEYAECALLMPFIQQGKAVLSVEYAPDTIDDETVRREICTEARDLQFSTLILPLELDDSFRYSCW